MCNLGEKLLSFLIKFLGAVGGEVFSVGNGNVVYIEKDEFWDFVFL